MKKILIIFVALLACVCLLAACGEQTDGGDGTPSETVTHDGDGFEAVSDGDTASDTADTEEESSTSENDDGIVELPTVPV